MCGRLITSPQTGSLVHKDVYIDVSVMDQRYSQKLRCFCYLLSKITHYIFNIQCSAQFWTKYKHNTVDFYFPFSMLQICFMTVNQLFLRFYCTIYICINIGLAPDVNNKMILMLLYYLS